MTEPQETTASNDGSSRSNLGMMVAAAAHIASGAEPAASSISSAARRPKLVLPELTDAMRVDLALTKRSSAAATKAALTPLSIGARPEYADYALRDIVKPHPNDVLCGRGGAANKHPGNESFRELVSEVKFPYVNLSKREKPLVARRIVEAVRNQTPPGRFLSKDLGTGLWNDIGDGKAREKTSQALREGAPIIRGHIIGKPPSSPVNAAAVLKEAKRAEKERDARLPGKSPEGEAAKAKAPVAHRGNAHAPPVLSKNEPGPGNNSLHDLAISNGGHHMPFLKKFRSFPGERDINNGAPPPAAWPLMQHQRHYQQQHQQRGRNFNMMPYGHHPGRTMGSYAPPHPGPADYPGRRGAADYPRGGGDYPIVGRGMPRYPSADSVPLGVVRQLLLGQLDPVQLAFQILPPDEAVAVFNRHNCSMDGPPPVPAAPRGMPTRPPGLHPIVSDGLSSTSSAVEAAAGVPGRTSGPSPDCGLGGGGEGGGDDGSSVESADSARRSNASEGALPKKKRKYVEA